MIELLKLCGFSEHDIDTELPRVEKAFEKLGITAADIERGKQRLNQYYDIELEGIRKAFRLCVLELVNSVLAREEGKKKIIFGYMIPGFETIGTALMFKSGEVFAAHHSWAFLLIIGCVFGKLVPILEAAEKKWLKAGAVAHCGNLKTLLGIVTLDMIPRPDMMVTSGFLCETAPKTVDLLHEFYGMPVYSWDTCHDRGSEDYADTADRSVDLAIKGLRRLVEKIQDIVGFEITDDMLWEALEARSRFDNAVAKVQHLIHSSDPLVLSPTHDNIWMCMSSLTFNRDTFTDAIDTLNTLYRELQERVSKGLGALPKGAPRVLGELFAHHADPRLEHLACEMGIAVVVATVTSTIHYEGRHEDPYVAMSRGWGGSLSAGFTRKIPMQIEVCKRMNIDGVLDRYHVGCRAVAGDALVIQNAIQKELGIPVLLLEWENFDPRVYNHEEYRRRLEVFKTMMTSGGG
jgi:benzoyl-CoA reductase/2-hydroxyglutaryl-CoA dehydratase subunit BcrC/BadD/HgdB